MDVDDPKQFYLQVVKNGIKNINLDNDPKIYHDYNNDELRFCKIPNCYTNISINSNEDIKYVDDILSAEILLKIYNFCMSGKHTLHSSRIHDNFNITFYNMHVSKNLYFYKLFYDVILPKIDITNKENLIIDRMYYNIHKFGSPGDWHCDDRSSINYGPSFLIYCNPRWDTRWEGATAFYTNRDNLEIKYIDIKPGRIGIFQPYIEHRATDLSGYAVFDDVKRVTLAIHTIYI